MQEMLEMPDGGRQVSRWTVACTRRTDRAEVASLFQPGSRPLLPLLSRPVVSLTPPLALPHAAPHVQATKANLRAEFAEEWAAFAAPEAEGAWQMLSSPAVVEALGAVLQRLSGGRKPGGGGSQAQSRL